MKLSEVKLLTIINNSKLPLNYQNIYECIKELYNPLLKKLETTGPLKTSTNSTLSKIYYCVPHVSVFELFYF